MLTKMLGRIYHRAEFLNAGSRLIAANRVTTVECMAAGQGAPRWNAWRQGKVQQCNVQPVSVTAPRLPALLPVPPG